MWYKLFVYSGGYCNCIISKNLSVRSSFSSLMLVCAHVYLPIDFLYIGRGGGYYFTVTYIRHLRLVVKKLPPPISIAYTCWKHQNFKWMGFAFPVCDSKCLFPWDGHQSFHNINSSPFRAALTLGQPEHIPAQFMSFKPSIRPHFMNFFSTQPCHM